MFRIGQLVVALATFRARTKDEARLGQFPEEGRIYTIRTIETNVPSEIGTITCLRFEEVINPILGYMYCDGEQQFAAQYFRPVKETSIDIFTEMLAPVNDKKELIIAAAGRDNSLSTEHDDHRCGGSKS